MHGNDKFKNWNTELELSEALQASFRKVDCQGKTDFFAHKSLFLREICKEKDPKSVASICVKHGLLRPDTEGKFNRSEEVSINKIKGRYYRFTHKVLEMHL